MNEEQLKTCYYLSGWKLFVYRLFINKVYPELKKGHEMHLKLIKEGHIAHPLGSKCAVCGIIKEN